MRLKAFRSEQSRVSCRRYRASSQVQTEHQHYNSRPSSSNIVIAPCYLKVLLSNGTPPSVVTYSQVVTYSEVMTLFSFQSIVLLSVQCLLANDIPAFQDIYHQIGNSSCRQCFRIYQRFNVSRYIRAYIQRTYIQWRIQGLWLGDNIMWHSARGTNLIYMFPIISHLFVCQEFHVEFNMFPIISRLFVCRRGAKVYSKTGWGDHGRISLPESATAYIALLLGAHSGSLPTQLL